VKDEQGTSAVEFAIVALPFFLFVLGLIGVGLYFFTMSSLSSGVEAAHDRSAPATRKRPRSTRASSKASSAPPPAATSTAAS
jgi:Flp pilus assembly protein TadG